MTHSVTPLQDNNTICALSTPAGGAISIIRVSGAKAIDIVERIFQAVNHKKLANAKGYTLHYGQIVGKDGEVVDEVMLSLFRSPHSYTGEDSVEISCHGSQYIVRQIIQLLIEAGCRQACPGEYTMRAYLNGKMDLSQAEAVADLIASTNKATHKMAMSQLKGHFSSELALLRKQLLKMTSLLELELDFSDHEELEFADRKELLGLAQTIDHHIIALARSFETGNAIKQGIPVAIVGKTNVGKSTLLNALLHEDKAIVSDIHGTTRDVIEDTTQIKGVTFRFIDTAGIRKTKDRIENLGIERTYQKIEEATIVLWLLDEQPSTAEVNNMMERLGGKKLIKVYNKIDLQPSPVTEKGKDAPRQLLEANHQPPKDNRLSQQATSPTPSASKKEDSGYVYISAKYGIGIAQLEEMLYTASDIPEINENSVIVTSTRHYEALIHAHDTLQRVMEGMDCALPGDLIAEDLRICLDQLSEITGGQITTNEVLSNIFKHFCVGK